jgi:glycosyltransferase involved in cell wall biosynthesis
MTQTAPRTTTPRRVLVMNWRDVSHPEGGGSERYVESVSRRLAQHGWDVTMLCATHPGHRGWSERDGVRMLHVGGRLSVYLRGLLHLLTHRYDVVVDVQNGVPFWSRLVTRGPVVVLVHHVHREVWPVAVGRLAARVGWWLESVVAPRVYRGCRYVTVSDATRRELVGLGVADDRIEVVHNGTEAWEYPDAPRSPQPRLCVVGRLVPHKQVEHAVEVVSALAPRTDVHLDVVGHGYWADAVRRHADDLGVADRVHLHGYVSNERKHELMSAAWVHLCPSLKEGWGLVCIEAARHGVPTVAYRHAGGVVESVQDGRTGVLVDDLPSLIHSTAALLAADDVRERLGAEAREFARDFSWDVTASRFSGVLDAVAGRAAQRSP